MVELSNLSISQNNIALGYAGDTLNTAIYLKRILADRAVVDYLTVLGEDFLSDQMKRYIQFEGIGIDHIRHSTRRNIGIYAINNDTSGERTFTYWRDTSAARLLFQDETDISSNSET
jgi:2-dehydro-3-deoxygluconokinase